MELVSRMVGEAIAAALFLGLLFGVLSVVGVLLGVSGLFHGPGMMQARGIGLNALLSAFVSGAWVGAKWGAVLGAIWGALKALSSLGRNGNGRD